MTAKKQKNSGHSEAGNAEISGQAEVTSASDSDMGDIEFLGKAVAVILIVVNVAWLIVIAPAIYNTLFPKF